MSHLFIGSSTVAHDYNDIQAFHLAEEKDLDISASTINCE